MNNDEIKLQLINARDEYIELIKAELLGPGSEFSVPDKEHELISSSPTSRYSVGILYPQGNCMQQDNDEIVPISEEGESRDIDFSEDDNAPATESAENFGRQSRYYLSDETANENLDEEIGMATQYSPASMGITFLISQDVKVIKGKAEFATYKKASVPDCMVPFCPDNSEFYEVPIDLSGIITYDKNLKAMRLLRSVKTKEIKEIFEKDTIPENEAPILKKIAYRMVDYLASGYVREPHEIAEFILDFSDSDYIDKAAITPDEGQNVKISALRRRMKDGTWSITVMMVNTFVEDKAKPYNCIFQPEIEISTDGNDFTFIESNPNMDLDLMDAEEKSLELLYRNKKIYATGLGTSADWDVTDSGIGKIWTDFFPIAEIPPMDFSLPENELITGNDLSMKYFSDLDSSEKEKKINTLRILVDLYKAWVTELEMASEALDPKYSTAAVKNISNCKQAYERMYSGIMTLENNEIAYNAFLLANRAMFMQRVHISAQNERAKVTADRYADDPDISSWLQELDYNVEDDTDCIWRPFQIAFLLMDINSIVNPDSEDRSLVDLIWFPTGGGKTEAYLGLTAFTIFYRRLAFPNQSDGTTVIMRYTLRLLASQQFTRAATLICACEYIRQDSAGRKHKYPAYPLGKTPITIGLWIGGTHIPNKNDVAEKHLDKLNDVSNPSSLKYEKERHNKFQVLKCPWCGTKMVKDTKGNRLTGHWGYAMSSHHFYMFCPHEDCDFTQRLPIQIIDEELYRHPPTLLFGTVDKFAMMPWDARTGVFFGVGTDNRTPELIIQDELHLISGALGTVVGLYETAIDELCSRKGNPPKIIASTATIRRAKEQCSVLYNRNVIQFPAPGLNAEDSFFAREAEINYEQGKFGRKYIGVMPSGKTKAMMEIRMMAALLQKVYTMNLPDPVKDKLWTVTAYFNSLRDLGKASTMVDDDVKDFIVRTANRMFDDRRLVVSADELTSRVSTTDLNETLDKLEKVEYSEKNIENKKYASSVLLATNMISVGIDVARLNVMLMVGQPKLTSEYIQASSRVGRLYPGVVFVQYDATKSRDRSHYERFRSYHESFYRFVEPTGATPFSKPARERALHAVLISMFRQETGLCEDVDASQFDKEYFEEQIQLVKNYVLDRVKGINERADNHLQDETDEIAAEIDGFFEHWAEMVSECQDEGEIPLYFGRKFMVNPPGSEERRLLKQFNTKSKDYSAIETLTSMRNVDISVKGEALIWED